MAIVDNAMRYPMMAERQVVIIKEMQDIDFLRIDNNILVFLGMSWHYEMFPKNSQMHVGQIAETCVLLLQSLVIGYLLSIQLRSAQACSPSLIRIS